MLARAILLKARILLLPLLHPAARLVVLLSSSSIDTWLLRVSQLQCRPDFSSIIPDLCDVFAEGRISHARGDAGARRSLLRSYRKLWVDPVLDACDVVAWSKAASNSEWPYGGFLSSFDLADHVLLDLDWGPRTWKHYRAWFSVRATGRIPLCLFDCGDMVRFLPACPLCGLVDADIAHLLSVCPGTCDLYASWSNSALVSAPIGARLMWPQLRELLFGALCPPNRCPMLLMQSRVQFVGGVIACVASSYCTDESAVVSPEEGMKDCPSLSGYSDGQRFS